MAVEIEIARRRLWWSGDLSDFDVLADVENARMAHRVPGDLDGRGLSVRSVAARFLACCGFLSLLGFLLSSF